MVLNPELGLHEQYSKFALAWDEFLQKKLHVARHFAGGISLCAFIDETNWEKQCEREDEMNAHHGPFDGREQKSHCEMDFSKQISPGSSKIKSMSTRIAVLGLLLGLTG